MTHGEIEKKAFEVFPKPNRCDYPNDDEYGNAIIVRSIQREGYIKAIEEIESLPKVKGYVARDKDGELSFWSVKPMRLTLDEDTCRWVVPGACYYLNLAYTNMFPEITWESEPVEVEFLIREL